MDYRDNRQRWTESHQVVHFYAGQWCTFTPALTAGYVWINSTGRYLGAPYGGWKQSGLGQEECFDELLSYTRIKNINMRW